MNLPQAFELLGLPETSSEAEVKRAFRHLAMTAHPDAGGTDQRMAELNAAYELCLTETHGREPLVPDFDGPCPECKGKKKVVVKKGFSSFEVVCPKCQR